MQRINNDVWEFVSISAENLEATNKVSSSLKEMKRVRINPPKEGRLYPTLSDIESGESAMANYTDDDGENPLLERYLTTSHSEYDDR